MLTEKPSTCLHCTAPPAPATNVRFGGLPLAGIRKRAAWHTSLPGWRAAASPAEPRVARRQRGLVLPRDQLKVRVAEHEATALATWVRARPSAIEGKEPKGPATGAVQSAKMACVQRENRTSVEAVGQDDK